MCVYVYYYFGVCRGNIHHGLSLPALCLEADSTNRVKGLPYPLASCFLAFWLLVGCGC